MIGKDSWKDPEELLEHAGWIRHLAFATLGDAQLAEDVSQEVLVKALAGPQRHGRVLRSWLGMVTKNSALNKIRARNRSLAREKKVARPEAEDDSRNRDVLFAYQEVMSAVDHLPNQHREILMLRFHQDLSLKEIAQHLEVKEGSARVRLHRALEALRGKLNQDGGSWEVSCLALLPFGIVALPWEAAKWTSPSLAMGAVAVCLAFIAGLFTWMQPSVEDLELPAESFAAMESTVEDPILEAEPVMQVATTVQRIDIPEQEKAPKVQGRHAWRELHGRVLLLGDGVAEADVQLWQNGELSSTLTLHDGTFAMQVDDLHPIDLTVVSGEMMTSLEIAARDRNTVLVHLTPAGERTELVPILVSYRLGKRPTSGAKIMVYLDRSNGARIPAARKSALELVAEGRTDEHGNFYAPAWLKDIRLAASVEAPGLLPVLAPLERQDYGYIYLDMDAVVGKARPVQLVYEDGTSAAKLKVNLGFYGESDFTTDADGFLPEVPSWGYCETYEELGPLPDAVLAHLPDGRLWSFFASNATKGLVKATSDLIQITVNRTPLQVRLRCDTLPDGTWVEARSWNRAYHSFSDGAQEKIWQRLEPGEYQPLDQSWLGKADRLETRLMPSGILLKEYTMDMEDDRFDVKLIIGELHMTLEGPSLEAGLPIVAMHRWWKTKVQTSTPFVDGAATFYYAFEEEKPFSVSIVHTETGLQLLREKKDGSVTMAGARSSKRVESVHVVESTHQYQPILIRMDGQPVVGGKVGGVGGKWTIALDGTVTLPMETDAVPALNYANLFLPAGMHQSPGGPITSAFNLDPWATPPGVFHRNPDGGWFWDLELAQVELLVSADSSAERRNITESVGRLVMFFNYPYHLEFDDQRGVHAGPDGGWIPFRVPAGTYAFQVADQTYGGVKGVAMEAGILNRMEPDTTIMPGTGGE